MTKQRKALQSEASANLAKLDMAATITPLTLLDLIVVEKILGLKGATCSLYRLATYVCHRTF